MKEIGINKKVLPAEKTYKKIHNLYDKLEYLDDIREYMRRNSKAFTKSELKEKYHKDLIYLKHISKKKIKKTESLFNNYDKKGIKLRNKLKMLCSVCGKNYTDFLCYDYSVCGDCGEKIKESYNDIGSNT